MGETTLFINSLAAIHDSIRWNSETDTALMDQMVSIFQQKYPNYDLTRQLVNKVNATKRIAIGAMAPGFVSIDTAGKKIELKSYRGKHPCRILGFLVRSLQGRKPCIGQVIQ